MYFDQITVTRFDFAKVSFNLKSGGLYFSRSLFGMILARLLVPKEESDLRSLKTPDLVPYTALR